MISNKFNGDNKGKAASGQVLREAKQTPASMQRAKKAREALWAAADAAEIPAAQLMEDLAAAKERTGRELKRKKEAGKG